MIEIAVIRVARADQVVIASDSHRLAPGVRGLAGEAVRETLGDLHFQRVIRGIGRVSIDSSSGKLRIEDEEIFRKLCLGTNRRPVP